MKNSEGGYVGLVILLLSLCFIVFFILRTDIFSGTDGNMIERGNSSIDRANDVTTQIEFRNQQSGE